MNVAQVTARQPVTAGRTTGRVNQLLVVAVAMAAAVGGFMAWWFLWPAGLPVGIAAGNGRIETTEIDTARQNRRPDQGDLRR